MTDSGSVALPGFAVKGHKTRRRLRGTKGAETDTMRGFTISQNKLQIVLFICVQTNLYLKITSMLCYVIHAMQVAIFLFTWLQDLTLRFTKKLLGDFVPRRPPELRPWFRQLGTSVPQTP